MFKPQNITITILLVLSAYNLINGFFQESKIKELIKDNLELTQDVDETYRSYVDIADIVLEVPNYYDLDVKNFQYLDDAYSIKINEVSEVENGTKLDFEIINKQNVDYKDLELDFTAYGEEYDQEYRVELGSLNYKIADIVIKAGSSVNVSIIFDDISFSDFKTFTVEYADDTIISKD